jgi:hypothetical protein
MLTQSASMSKGGHVAAYNMQKGLGRSTCRSEPWDRCLNLIPWIYWSIDLNRSSKRAG